MLIIGLIVTNSAHRSANFKTIIKMEKYELKEYQRLSKFQKEVVDALINLGFTYKYLYTYEHNAWGEVKVYKFKRWSDVLIHVHQLGKDQKRFEFQRVLDY